MSNPDSENQPSALDRLNRLDELTAAGEESDTHDLERVKIQERKAREKLERLRHTFLSVVNHEMRTPLVLILQSVELLDSERLGSLSPDQLDALMVLKRQSQKLDQMIQSLTRVAAFLSKQDKIKPVWGRLTPVFQEVLPLIEFQARSKQIVIKTDIESDLPPLPIDVKQMEEVLAQLLDNAIKFTNNGGSVTVAARSTESWVILSVKDTGVGIEPERLDTIWEVFEQHSDPIRRAQEGLGLGLVVVRYITDAHRGIVEVDTEPGKGTTFTIKLPRIKRR